MTELSDEQVDAFLGAYALDACDPDETAAIDAVLARRPDLAAEAQRLARAAAWIGAAHATRAPDGLRSATLAAATARRTNPADPVVDLYLSESEWFAHALEAVRPESMSAATANGLTVRELAVHVAAQESLLAQLIGEPTLPDVTETDIDERTAAAIAAFDGRDLADVVDAWREAMAANQRWALAGAADSAVWRGLELSRHDALVVRAFETWVHSEDVRRVVGLPPRAPAPEHLTLMTDLAGRTLGLSLALAGRQRAERTAQLVLTGAGGGEWLVAMGDGDPGGHVDVVVTADAVEWCMLVGDRVAPTEIAVTVDGDRSLADDLLAAAPALATL